MPKNIPTRDFVESLVGTLLVEFGVPPSSEALQSAIPTLSSFLFFLQELHERLLVESRRD